LILQSPSDGISLEVAHANLVIGHRGESIRDLGHRYSLQAIAAARERPRGTRTRVSSRMESGGLPRLPSCLDSGRALLLEDIEINETHRVHGYAASDIIRARKPERD
jgi:hypothetical protein